MQTIKELFSGNPAPRELSASRRAIAVIGLVLLTASAAWAVYARVGPWFETPAAQQDLRLLAEKLNRADRTGDSAAAEALFADVAASMRAANERLGAHETAAFRSCALAAFHLTQGVVSVSEGATWHSRARFEAALRECE